MCEGGATLLMEHSNTDQSSLLQGRGRRSERGAGQLWMLKLTSRSPGSQHA